jgi:hypothetical protein
MARNVAQAAINHVARVRVTQARTPQAKSDITDHLDAGYKLSQLEPVEMRAVRRTRWTLAELLATEPEPLRWVLPGIIPEGLTLLVGPPKVGKSWFNLNLMAALATGRPDSVFGWGDQMEKAESLYLALEDPFSRVHLRMNKVTRDLGFDARTAGDVWLDLPPIDEGGKEEIERWLENHPLAKAVMVDVLAKVRQSGEGQTMYQADYESVGALKEIADTYGVGVIVTHHDRKKGDDDFVNQVSGTKGVTGAADTILLLSRTKREGTEGELKLESRDVESAIFKAVFVREYGRWQIMDREEEDDSGSGSPAKTPLKDQAAQVILTRGPTGTQLLAKMLDVAEATLKRALVQAEQGGELARDDQGNWYVPKGRSE